MTTFENDLTAVTNQLKVHQNRALCGHSALSDHCVLACQYGSETLCLSQLSLRSIVSILHLLVFISPSSFSSSSTTPSFSFLEFDSSLWSAGLLFLVPGFFSLSLEQSHSLSLTPLVTNPHCLRKWFLFERFTSSNILVSCVAYRGQQQEDGILRSVPR